MIIDKIAALENERIALYQELYETGISSYNKPDVVNRIRKITTMLNYAVVEGEEMTRSLWEQRRAEMSRSVYKPAKQSKAAIAMYKNRNNRYC